MFRLIDNGACRGEDILDQSYKDFRPVEDTISCANVCNAEDDCRGYEFSPSSGYSNNCWIFDWSPVQVCTTADCINGDVEEYECYVRTTEELYYTLDEECIAPTEITSQSQISFSSCLDYCSKNEECVYVSFGETICTLLSDCTEWLLPAGESSGDVVKTAGRLDFHSGHVWTTVEDCSSNQDTVAHCRGDEEYLNDCFDNCDEDIDCDAVILDLDQESVSNFTSDCSPASLTLSSGLLFLKGDPLELYWLSENSTDDHFQTKMMTKLLYAGLIIIIAFCVFHWLARAASHSREQLYNRRAAAVIFVNSINRRSSPLQTNINPTEVWRYLKEVPTPEWSGSEECCSICLDSFDKVVTRAPCGHIFHKQCIQHWLLNTKKECPICRSKVYAAPPPGPAPFDAIVSSGDVSENPPQ